MRPITLSSIYEVLTALKNPLSLEEFIHQCGFTPSRAREVIRQVKDMGLVKLVEERYLLTTLGRAFIEAYRDEDYSTLHEILMVYEPYRKLFNLLMSGRAFKIEDLCKRLGVSAVGVDVLIRLMRKVGIKVVRSAAGEYYVEKNSVEYYKFKEALLESYTSLLAGSRLPRRYVALPELREAVKERLRISDEAFDKLLYAFIRENVGKVILSPAPSAAKRGRGVKFGRIEYYYIYISRENNR